MSMMDVRIHVSVATAFETCTVPLHLWSLGDHRHSDISGSGVQWCTHVEHLRSRWLTTLGDTKTHAITMEELINHVRCSREDGNNHYVQRLMRNKLVVALLPSCIPAFLLPAEAEHGTLAFPRQWQFR
jgi:hypothetical protein